MDQFAVYFKAVCGGTVSGRSAFGVSACRRVGVRRVGVGNAPGPVHRWDL
jgi:hypothetical protein